MLNSKMLTAILGIIPGLSLGQTPPAPQFEVASIKQAAVGVEGYRGGCHGTNSVFTPARQATAPPLGSCVIRGARLSHLISTAFGIPLVNLKTGPDWIQRGDVYFDVQAIADVASKPTEQQLLTMLQNLLVERFQLKFHSETTEQTGLALTVDKDGPKLKASEGEETVAAFTGPNGERLPGPIPGQRVSLTARKFPIATLANLLTVVGGRVVLDKTSLAGTYDFTLTWDENAGPALSTALREHLGLRMDATRVPVSTFVVDSAQMPSPN